MQFTPSHQDAQHPKPSADRPALAPGELFERTRDAVGNLDRVPGYECLADGCSPRLSFDVTGDGTLIRSFVRREAQHHADRCGHPTVAIYTDDEGTTRASFYGLAGGQFLLSDAAADTSPAQESHGSPEAHDACDAQDATQADHSNETPDAPDAEDAGDS